MKMEKLQNRKNKNITRYYKNYNNDEYYFKSEINLEKKEKL